MYQSINHAVFLCISTVGDEGLRTTDLTFFTRHCSLRPEPLWHVTTGPPRLGCPLADPILHPTGWWLWWLTYPSEKYEFVNWDDEIPNYEKKKVPNHQPNISEAGIFLTARHHHLLALSIDGEGRGHPPDLVQIRLQIIWQYLTVSDSCNLKACCFFPTDYHVVYPRDPEGQAKWPPRMLHLELKNAPYTDGRVGYGTRMR